jgi:hypothetical protein
MLKAVNFDLDTVNNERERIPRLVTPGDLCYWYVTPERHQAYSTFWMYATIINAVANAAIWVYM